MTNQQIAIAFNLIHPPADPDAIKLLVQNLRLKAIALGFLRVGDLVFLQGDAEILSHEYGERFLVNDLPITPFIPTKVCYFTGSLADSEVPVEFGLALCSTGIEVDGLVVPFGMPDWTWTGAARTRDLRTFSLLVHHAVEIGMWASMSFAGITLVYNRTEAGVVEFDKSGTIFPTTAEWRLLPWDRGFALKNYEPGIETTPMQSP